MKFPTEKPKKREKKKKKSQIIYNNENIIMRELSAERKIWIWNDFRKEEEAKKNHGEKKKK